VLIRTEAKSGGERLHFEFQEIEGNFGAAERVVAIASTDRAQYDPEYGTGRLGIIVTLDVDGDVVHEVYSGEDCALDGVFDLDGDGVNEILYTAYGYEDLDQRLVKLSASSTEDVQIFQHEE
jgi:hypothetical protein